MATLTYNEVTFATCSILLLRYFQKYVDGYK